MCEMYNRGSSRYKDIGGLRFGKLITIKFFQNKLLGGGNPCGRQ